MPWVMLAMAAMKAQEDSTKNNQAKQLTAVEQRNAPYTHMQPKPYDPSASPSTLATLTQGGVGGLQMQQNMDAQAQNKQLNDALIAYYKHRAGGGADPLTSGQAGTGANLGSSSVDNPWADGGANTAMMSMYGSKAPGAAMDGYGTEGVNVDPSANPALWNGSTMDALNTYGTG